MSMERIRAVQKRIDAKRSKMRLPIVVDDDDVKVPNPPPPGVVKPPPPAQPPPPTRPKATMLKPRSTWLT